MPFVKTTWTRTPNAYVLNTLGTETIGPITLGASVVTSSVSGYIILPATVKITKIGVGWQGYSGATTFNLVYNTVQNIASGTTNSYTSTNVAPNDNSQSAGVTTSTSGASLVSSSVSPLSVNNGTPGYPNPALTTAYPLLNQQGGLGIPTNFAVDGQPVFYGDVTLNTTNFPGSSSSGGYNILYPANTDAVYPSGPNPYAGAVYSALANMVGVLTLRCSTTTSLTNFTATVFYEPISIAQAVEPSNLQVVPGVNF